MYQWVVYVHILAAMVWVGGMLFLGFALVPALRAESPAIRSAIMGRIGRQFRWVGWGAIAILLITGVWNLRNRHFSWDMIANGDVFRGTWGHILAVKLALVLILILLSLYHDFILGPASTRAGDSRDTEQGRRRAESFRRRASWFGRIDALLALVIVWLAVMLVRGLPW